jgi:hypothetical protein
MRCKRCRHLVEESCAYPKGYWKKYGSDLFHKRNSTYPGYLGREIERYRHFRGCFCGCKYPLVGVEKK